MKRRTDTIMGEDLKKIFNKLNNDMETLNSPIIKEKKLIARKFEIAKKRKRMLLLTMLLVISIGSLLYYHI